MLAVPFTALTVVVIINVGLGAMNTLAASGMNKIEVPEGPLLSPVAFRHPFVQTLVMMIGEASCLAAFALLYWRKPNGPSPWRGGLLFFAIPSICDWCGTTMMYAALSDLPGSVVRIRNDHFLANKRKRNGPCYGTMLTSKRITATTLWYVTMITSKRITGTTVWYVTMIAFCEYIQRVLVCHHDRFQANKGNGH
eukprot:GEMP01081715.1.p1 GENE.GEMP01081715.1~~GEMP01081715.1.p1  ORF type:complete len:195 (+),score=17.02 GEMP01081715.1:376-960(+)